jgi:hypothetical protein
MFLPSFIQHHLSTNIRNPKTREELPPRNITNIEREIMVSMRPIQNNQANA